MPLFKAPDGKHYKFNEYDEEFVVPNSKTQKVIDTQFNNNVIAKQVGDKRINQWNRNHYSTRKKVYRDIVVKRDFLIKDSVDYHTRRIKPRKWNNW